MNRERRAGRRLRADLDELFAAAARCEITFERAMFIAGRVNDRNAGAFTGAEANSFEQVLEAETNRLWRRIRKDRRSCPEIEMPTRAQIRAQAL